MCTVVRMWLAGIRQAGVTGTTRRHHFCGASRSTRSLLPPRCPRNVERCVGPRRSSTAVPRDRSGHDNELRRSKRTPRADVGRDRQRSLGRPDRSRASVPGLDGDARWFDCNVAGRAARALTVETFHLDVRCRHVRTGNAEHARALPERGNGRWPATLTVIPGPHEGQSESVGWEWIAAIAGVGLMFIAGLTLLAWRRKTASV